jgi:hypothetical protein
MGCNPTGRFEVCFLWPHRIILTLVSGFTLKRRVTTMRPQIEWSNRYNQRGISTSNMVRVKSSFVKFSARTNPSSQFVSAAASYPPRPPRRTGQDGTNNRSFCALWCAMTVGQQKIQTRMNGFIDKSFMTHRAPPRKNILLP